MQNHASRQANVACLQPRGTQFCGFTMAIRVPVFVDRNRTDSLAIAVGTTIAKGLSCVAELENKKMRLAPAG
jgi:hypothetical protein